VFWLGLLLNLYFRYTFLIGKPPFETSDVKKTYKRIRANNYIFPDHITLTKNALDLIEKILVLDPNKRLSFDQILMHDFFQQEQFIPRFMPISTLALPPRKLEILSNQKEATIEKKGYFSSNQHKK